MKRKIRLVTAVNRGRIIRPFMAGGALFFPIRQIRSEFEKFKINR